MRTLNRIGLVLALSGACFACAKKESTTTTTTDTTANAPVPTIAVAPTALPVARVEKIAVVKTVQADKSPGEAATSFGKKDTVYVSFWVADAPVGTELKARWTDPAGKMLTEDKIVTDKAGDGYSEFHAAKKSGWKPGTYKVEIMLNGQPAGSTSFTIS